MKKLVTIALLSGAALFHPSPASACSCFGFPTFEEKAQAADIVVAGRVAAIGDLKDDSDPASVDVDVEWVGKGAVAARSIRVWNVMAGSSCGGELKPLKVGALVGLALAAVESPDASAAELRDLMDIHPAAGDFEVLSGCGVAHKLFQTKRDRDRWIAQALK